MNPNEEELIDLLRSALQPQRPESVEPSRLAVARLRDSVSSRFALPPVGRRRGAHLAVAASVFLGVSGSTAGAFASGATLPTPLRVVAQGIGLPVDSVGLAQAKTDADRLRGALDKGEAVEISRDAETLQSRFAELSGSDRRSIGSEVDGLLDRAGPYDGRSDDGPGSVAPGSSAGIPAGTGTPVSGRDADDGGPTSTSVPQGAAVAPSTSDGGGGGGGDGSRSGGGSSATSTTPPPSGSGDVSSPTTTGGTDGGGGSSGGGSVVQTDGGGGSSDGGSVLQTDGGGH